MATPGSNWKDGMVSSEAIKFALSHWLPLSLCVILLPSLFFCVYSLIARWRWWRVIKAAHTDKGSQESQPYQRKLYIRTWHGYVAIKGGESPTYFSWGPDGPRPLISCARDEVNHMFWPGQLPRGEYKGFLDDERLYYGLWKAKSRVRAKKLDEELGFATDEAEAQSRSTPGSISPSSGSYYEAPSAPSLRQSSRNSTDTIRKRSSPRHVDCGPGNSGDSENMPLHTLDMRPSGQCHLADSYATWPNDNFSSSPLILDPFHGSTYSSGTAGRNPSPATPWVNVSNASRPSHATSRMTTGTSDHFRSNTERWYAPHRRRDHPIQPGPARLARSSPPNARLCTPERRFLSNITRQLTWLQHELSPGFRGPEDNPAENYKVYDRDDIHVSTKSTRRSRLPRTTLSPRKRDFRRPSPPSPKDDAPAAVLMREMEHWRAEVTAIRKAAGSEDEKTSLKAVNHVSDANMPQVGIDTAAYVLRQPPMGNN